MRARVLTALGGAALLAVVLVASGVLPGWERAPLRDGTAERMCPLLAFGAVLAAYGLLAVAAVSSAARRRGSAGARSIVGRVLLGLAPVALFLTAVLPQGALDGVAALTFALKATGSVAGVLGLLGVGFATWALSRDAGRSGTGALARPGSR